MVAKIMALRYNEGSKTEEAIDMTLGQRIAEQRKKLGISQEALGEKAGVSRQAISKWEADGAVPEIDKLIALSRLFGVSVGWLLGVEEEPETKKRGGFSEEQLRLVEEIVKRYQPQPVKRKIWPAIAAGALAVFAAVMLYQLNREMTGLQASVTAYESVLSRVESAISAQDSRLSTLEAAMYTPMSAPNQLLEEYSFDFALWEEAVGGDVTFYGVPGSWQPGDEAYLDVSLNGETIAHPLCHWSGSSLSATVPLAAENGYKLCLTIVHADGTQEQQVLTEEHVQNMRSALCITASGKIGSAKYSGDNLLLQDIHVSMTMPDHAFNNGNPRWKSADLLLVQGGEERSRYALQDFEEKLNSEVASSYSIDSLILSAAFQGVELAEGQEIQIWLEVEMENGLSETVLLHVYAMSDGKLISLL